MNGVSTYPAMPRGARKLAIFMIWEREGKAN